MYNVLLKNQSDDQSSNYFIFPDNIETCSIKKNVYTLKKS